MRGSSRCLIALGMGMIVGGCRRRRDRGGEVEVVLGVRWLLGWIGGGLYFYVRFFFCVMAVETSMI